MSTVVPVLLFAVAGILFGGCWSLYRQDASRVAVAAVGLLGALALAAGIAWLVPK